MFFPERIKGIKDGYHVLEIGPGATPHPQAHVFLEKRYLSEEDYIRQCGGLRVNGKDSRIVFFDGGRFPFDDAEFDYVICSHVLEHVAEVEYFCSELFRVGKSGYLEYPLLYYEYVYDIPEHINLLKMRPGGLVYMPKRELPLDMFSDVQRFWFETLTAGYGDTVRDLAPLLMEGFEWFGPFVVRRAVSVGELLNPKIKIVPKVDLSVRRSRKFSSRLLSAKNRMMGLLSKFRSYSLTKQPPEGRGSLFK